MEQYGSYEVIKELSAAQGFVVYLARAKSGGIAAAEGFVVKAFSSGDFIGGGTQLWRRGEFKSVPLKPRVYADPEAFLNAVRKQQRASSQGSPYIAPVVGSGRDERGAWYATRFYPHSIKNIIEGRVSLTRDVFFHVIRSITRGLLVFKRISGQSHGNLKPGNVLIGGEKKIRQAEIVLVDPSPYKTDEARAYELSDLHALGEIMYQLVRRKEVEGTAHWPLVSSPEWSNLFGETADAWRELCNKLLDPQLSAHPITLEELEVELARLEPKPPVSKSVLVAIVTAVLLLAVAGYFLVSHLMSGKYGSIEITSAPPGAEVLLDDKQMGRTPYRATKLPPGDMSYWLKLERHNDYRVNTNIVAGMKAKLHIVLSHQLGTVVLTSDPLGAEILTNEVIIGNTPFTNTLLTGTHRFTLRYPNLQEQKLIVPVENKQTTEKFVVFPRAEIRVRSEPAGAIVLIGGRPIGNTPTNLVFDPGQVTFELQMDGYNSATVKTNVLARGKLDIAVALSKGQGAIGLLSDPAGAEVYWKDKLQGRTPVYLTLPRGMQEFVLRYGHLTEQTRTADVGKEMPDIVVFPRANLIVQSDPSGAEVLMGTNVVGITPTNLVVNPGNVELALRLSDFSGTVKTNLPAGAYVAVHVPLSIGLGRVYVNSYPSGASIFSVEGRPLGSAGSSIELPKGVHGLIARHLVYTNLEEQRFSVVVEKDAAWTNEVKFPYGSLVIRSRPEGAAIFQDEKRIGATPHTNLFLKPGPVAYELRLEDYRVEIVATNAVDGQTLTVNPQLERGIGIIAFTSEPSGAQILVNGSLVGTTPRTNTVPTGTNLVVARYGNLGEQMTTVVVRMGDEKTVPFRFELPTTESMTNSIGMVLVKVGDDYWVGQSKVTVSEYEQIFPGGAPAVRGNRQPLKATWTDAITFCGHLTAREQALGKLSRRNDLAYSLPRTNEWTQIVQVQGLARSLAAEPAGEDAWEWCFTTQGGLSQPAPTIAVARGPTDQLRTGTLKLRDKDLDTVTFRCVLVPRNSREKQ